MTEANPIRDPVRAALAALAELVALRDLKSQMEALAEKACTPQEFEQADAMEDEYLRRKSGAWATARAALAEPAWVPVPPVQGDRFVRAWINLPKLPGGMMMGNDGPYGPIGALTNCAITTSEVFRDEWESNCTPFIEVWLAPSPPTEET